MGVGGYWRATSNRGSRGPPHGLATHGEFDVGICQPGVSLDQAKAPIFGRAEELWVHVGGGVVPRLGPPAEGRSDIAALAEDLAELVLEPTARARVQGAHLNSLDRLAGQELGFRAVSHGVFEAEGAKLGLELLDEAHEEIFHVLSVIMIIVGICSDALGNI